MTLEIIGNTINGSGGGDYATEITNMWDDTVAVADGWTDNGGTMENGIAKMSTGENSNANWITPDLLPLMSRTNISFMGTACISAGATSTATNDGYNIGWDGNAYIRLTDESGNSQNLLLVDAQATRHYNTDAASAGSFISAVFNLSLSGNTITVTRGGLTASYANIADNGIVSSTPVAATTTTLIADGTTVDISSWSSLKIQVYCNTYDARSSGYSGRGFSVATMGPIMMINSKLGSNRNE